ncbi:hypothetical protein GUJ93_ZPchr0003g17453 [Zizania palustris]|uniref:Uncharacterized protein n=1 Tax=Zizania palustris TaxID=103762 RepID=A0A8J5S687_ZIZPA|nr:hypothetical protein GUJ93_ZPchr0003g17453 [Zizania palustris]
MKLPSGPIIVEPCATPCVESHVLGQVERAWKSSLRVAAASVSAGRQIKPEQRTKFGCWFLHRCITTRGAKHEASVRGGARHEEAQNRSGLHEGCARGVGDSAESLGLRYTRTRWRLASLERRKQRMAAGGARSGARGAWCACKTFSRKDM